MNTYISVDVETSGPVPGLYDMIELGAAAYNPRTYEFEAFSACLWGDGPPLPLEMPVPWRWDLDTSNWWHKTPDSTAMLAAIYNDVESPKVVMDKFHRWLSQFMRPVIVCWPVSFDSAFLNYYWWKYVGTMPPFSFSALDLKTMAMTILGCDYRDAGKRRLQEAHPDFFRPDLAHTHRALDDAKEQAFLHHQMAMYLRQPMPKMITRPYVDDNGLHDVIDKSLPVSIMEPGRVVFGCITCPHPLTDHSDDGGCYVKDCRCAG